MTRAERNFSLTMDLGKTTSWLALRCSVRRLEGGERGRREEGGERKKEGEWREVEGGERKEGGERRREEREGGRRKEA